MRKLLLVPLLLSLFLSCSDDAGQSGPQDVPVDLRALSIAATAATITYKAPLDTGLALSNYRIRISPAGQTNGVVFGHTLDTTVRLTNLTAATAYSVVVEVQDVFGVYHPPGATLDFSTGLAGWQVAGNSGLSSGMADSLALAVRDDHLILAYADQGLGYGAVVRQLAGNSWEAISSGSLSSGAAEGIVLSEEGALSLLFCDSGVTNRGRAMQYDGSDWKDIGLFSSATADALAAITISGVLYAAFSDAADGGRLLIRCYSNQSWHTVGSNASPGAVDFISLAARDGVLYAAFADGGDGWKAHVVRYTGTTWESVASGLSSGDAEYLSLRFIGGIPYLAFCDGGDGYRVMVTSPGSGGSWSTCGGGPLSAGAAEFSVLGVYLGQPVVAYMDNAVGDKASVRTYNGMTWAYLGSAGCTPADIDGLAFTVLHNIPYLAISDGSLGYKASVYRFNE